MMRPAAPASEACTSSSQVCNRIRIPAIPQYHPRRKQRCLSASARLSGQVHAAAITVSRLAGASSGAEEYDRPGPKQSSSGPAEDYLEFPSREARVEPKKEPRLVRVRLSVHYRVHSRQILCVGGSQIPFGWSFLSIAKVPMAWTADDNWEVEVRLLLLPANIYSLKKEGLAYVAALVIRSSFQRELRWSTSTLSWRSR